MAVQRPLYHDTTTGNPKRLPVGDTCSGAPSFVTAMLETAQTNSTVTPVTLTGHTFVIPPGETLKLDSVFVFSTTAATTGALLGLKVSQAAGANSQAKGSVYIDVGMTSAAAATALSGGGVFLVAANTNATVSCRGTASSGNTPCKLSAIIKNTATVGDTTVEVVFASEVAGQVITALIGTAATALFTV